MVTGVAEVHRCVPCLSLTLHHFYRRRVMVTTYVCTYLYTNHTTYMQASIKKTIIEINSF